MGGKQCKPVVDSAEAKRLLRPDELEEVRRVFVSLSEAKSVRDGISKERMLAWLNTTLPKTNPLILSRMFQLFDLDANNIITYSEFVIAAYILQYTQDNYRLKQIFNLYDLEGTGKLTRKGFTKISRALLGYEDAKNSQGESMKSALAPLMRLHSTMTFLHAAIDNAQQSLSYNEWRRYALSSIAVHDLLQKMRRATDASVPLGPTSKPERDRNGDTRFGPFEYAPAFAYDDNSPLFDDVKQKSKPSKKISASPPAANGKDGSTEKGDKGNREVDR